jgi:hypothetical protein
MYGEGWRREVEERSQSAGWDREWEERAARKEAVNAGRRGRTERYGALRLAPPQ